MSGTVSISTGAPRLPSPWTISVLVHLALSIPIAIALWPRAQSENIDFEVYEQPKASAAALQIAKPKEAPPPTRRAVFGQSRNALTAADASAPQVKAGNTVAKDPDAEKLRDDDADSLPVPADEYLVSQMPRLLNETRIPYPDEAKRKGVQGAVIMDLLIDAQGVVRTAAFVSGPGSGLNEAAMGAIRSFKFQPARVQDRPVAVKIRYAYRFVLER